MKFVTAKLYLYYIKISSKPINVIFFSRLASIDCFGIKHILSLLISIGILNVIYDVFLSGRSNLAMPEKAIKKKILLDALK